MIRDLARLANTRFDALVIGGGVYGLATAWELASRGVSVALVERGDFGAATSFNSLKTVHGGIRSLQHGAVGEMREFVRERRTIATIAPHLVRPLPFIVPTYRHLVRNRLAMGLFFAAYDRLSADRNRGVEASRALPPSRTVNRAECLRLNPAIDPAGVTGGAIWHDYQLHSPERFALALLRSATEAGAQAANYVEAEGLLLAEGRVRGARVIDRLSGAAFDIQAPVVVNAAGPWAWRLLERLRAVPTSQPAPRFSLAMNAVLDRPAPPLALGGMAHGRFLFLVPWRDRAIVGTSHDQQPGASAPEGLPEVPAALLDGFLREAAAAFPAVRITPDAVRLVHRGLLPAGTRAGSLAKRSIVHDHRTEGLPGLVSLVGVRYTTARATAARAAATVIAALGRGFGPAVSATRPLAGGDLQDLPRYEREHAAAPGWPAEAVRRLISAYGTHHAEILALASGTPGFRAPLSASSDITGAEIVHAVRHEMAVHLSDALLRRTNTGAGGHPGAETITRAADLMAAECGWPAARRAEEIEAVEAYYRAP
jgi:glycerol-3-phosphate dehydrogenase